MIVQQFLVWMRTAPAPRRIDAIQALARAFLHSDLDEATREGMEAAMTVMLDDGDASIRFALADVLSTSPAAPRHIILTLATDLSDIAALVLGRSPVLLDEELVDFAAAGDAVVQIAIARREPMSRTVAAALAEVGSAAACYALLANPSAILCRSSFRRLAERFGERADIRELLFDRPELPLDVRQMLIRQFSEALAAFAKDCKGIGRDQVAQASREACERATVALAADADPSDLAMLVEHLRETRQLTTMLLLRALCAGNVPFFELALADLSGVPVNRVANLIRGGRIAALRAVYSRAGLPPVAFEAFAAALETCREIARAGGPTDGFRFARLMGERILERYRSINGGEGGELVALVRRFAAEAARSAARDYVESYIEAA